MESQVFAYCLVQTNSNENVKGRQFFYKDNSHVREIRDINQKDVRSRSVIYINSNCFSTHYRSIDTIGYCALICKWW